MAHSGKGQEPVAGGEDNDYAQGSPVPPPPSYNEALSMQMEGAADPSDAQKRIERQMRLHPLSDIEKYKSSWLYPLMMRVKDTLHGVRKEVKFMEDDKGKLGEDIKSLENKSYLAMLTLCVTGIPSNTEGSVLSRGTQPLLDASRHDESRSENMKYATLETDLWKDMKPIRTWTRKQLESDRDWTGETNRVPVISNIEVRELKTSMMKVESKRTSMESMRRAHSAETRLVDYATDMLLKLDMEFLWSFLIRIGDDFIDKEEDTDDEKEDDYVPEGDTDGLRKKRLEFYKHPGSQRASGSESQEDKEQEEEMLPRLKVEEAPERSQTSSPPPEGSDMNVGEDEEAKGSIATGGKASVSNTEEDQLRMRRLLLYRLDSKDPGKSQDDVVEEVEMLPVVRIVSEEDIDVETNSLPRSGSPDSYREAVDGSHLDTGRYSPKHSYMGDHEPGATVQQFEIDDTEAGRQRNRRRSEYDVGSLPIPFLREIVNFVVHKVQYTKDRWPEWSVQKRLILVFSVLFVVGLVLLVTLLPSSFVYVDYDKMGFVYNRATGKTDTDRVYEFGCYLLAPQHSLVLFPATAHFLDLKMSVMNKAGLTIGLDVYLQYLLRPNELSLMYQKYHGEYEKIIEIMAESTVKNTAIQFTLEEYRLNRSLVEATLFHKLKRVLSGDCCNEDNDRYGRFQTLHSHPSIKNESYACNANKNQCDKGFYIDLAFFQLGDISVPNEVMSHYLKQIILRIETEKELYLQEKAVEVKRTSLSVQNITNQARELKEKAKAESAKIKKVSEASRLKILEQSYVQSLKKTYELLKITEEEEKASLLFLNTLKKIKDNLLAFSYNYDQETVVSP